MQAKKTQKIFSTVKRPIRPEIIHLSKNFRQRGDLTEISNIAYGDSRKSANVYYALLIGKADDHLATTIEKYYAKRLHELQAV